MDREALDSLQSSNLEYDNSDSSLYCISCEWCISTDYHPWMASYQALYLTPNGAQLSDVAVTDFTYLEAEYFDTKKLGTWWAMAKSKPANAFLVHSCCWPVLIKHFPNEEANLDRLFEVCKDRPSSRRARYWGNDHNRIREYPWYPLQRPIIRGIGDATKQLSKIQRLEISSGNNTLMSDCFSLLAIEMRIEIASYLSTVDFLALRSASRAMALVFSLQSFWKTRFLVNGDRGFLAYSADYRSRQRKNWRSMYRCTSKIRQPYLDLWALRRHWMNNRWLADRCSMIKALVQTRVQNDLLGEVPWKEVAAAKVRCDRNYRQGKDENLCKRCWEAHTLVTQAVSLQNPIIGLAVFILDEPTKLKTKTYLTGFDLINAKVGTPNATIGYRIPGKQVIIDLYNKQLRGFTAVADDGGIRAIRPTFNSNIVPSWVGDPGYGEMPITEVILREEIKAISAKFDHCKMISLSIA